MRRRLFCEDVDFSAESEYNTDWKSQVPMAYIKFLQGTRRYIVEDRRHNIVRSKCECHSAYKYHVPIKRMTVWRETKLLRHDIAVSVHQVTRQQCDLDTWPKSVQLKPSGS